MRPTRVAFRQEHTGDATLDRAQRLAQQSAQIQGACPFVNGVKVASVSLSTSDATVNHKLGRTPAGCLVLKSTAAVSIAFSGTQPSDTTRQSAIKASGTATCDLWFF